MQRFFLVLAVLVAAAIAKDLKCPSVPGKFPFDAEKLAGQWYTVAGAFSGKSSKQYNEMRCLKMTVSTMGSGTDKSFSMRMTYMLNEKNSGKEIFSQPYKADKPSTSYAVYKIDGEDTWSNPYKETIMATDYENYALVFVCQPLFNEATKSFESNQAAFILSRTPTLKSEYMEVLQNIITSFDIKSEEIKYMQHSNC